MDAVNRLWTYGGVGTRTQIARTTAERRAVTAAVAAGQVRDLGAGWLALADAQESVVVARRMGAAITCVSIAEFFDLPLLVTPDRPHIALPRRRGRRSIDMAVRVHGEGSWTAPLPVGLPLAPLADALARVLRCRPTEEAAVVLDAALRKGLVAPEAVRRTLTGRGSPAALATLERCSPRSRSVIETRARLALEDAGLIVSAGVKIDGVGEVDLVVEGRIVVECDGFAYHSGRAEYREDRRRDRALLERGYLVLRFTWEEIMQDPRVIVSAVKGLLGGS
ncbi:DUF559 domain-containing protein [Oceanitalea stevensii]|uniref:DUF559 domain-containing protein n=1 Tax=Oceanitalea stevensii TaxID=2763072 RepID=A0ABR8Z318_9MICO|nr:DUF559 domain-containing protein [Oceanitalea stevensii]MBD8062737.1 DUF559 domain-containing protein [Oceanitalea stevensii]